jgi:hypothetical protein
VPLDGLEHRVLPFAAPPMGLPGEAAEFAVELLPGLFIAAVVATGDQIDFVGREAMTALGGPDRVHALAARNVAQLPEPAIGPPMLTVQGDPSSGFWALQTEDVFGAARLAALPRLVELITKSAIPHGIFVAAPHWWLVLLHILRGKGAMSAIEGMAQVAAAEHRRVSERARITSRVYWIDGALDQAQVVASDARGRIEVSTRGPVSDALFGPNGVLREDG